MSHQDPERLRRYLELITRSKGGLESALETIQSLEPAASGFELESLEPEPKPLGAARSGIEKMLLDREIGPEQV